MTGVPAILLARRPRARGLWQRSCSVAPRRCDMKATDLLKKQHREVKGLFKKIKEAEGARERQQLMGEIAQQLQLHTKLEEEIFYPAVRQAPSKKAEQMINEAFEDHHVVDLLL